MAHLSARADAAYQNDYHHKLRGRLWDALGGTDYDERHDGGEPPGFAYSNPFPYDLKEGNDRKLLVASPEEELLANVATDLLEERELNVSEMRFHADDVTSLEPDVGEPGTRGTIETNTSLFVRIPPWRREEYGIDYPSGAVVEEVVR
ncbi:CRISPR-associated protein Cas6 [Halorubrum coriense DSM 10284]|uniref:CRISPR-associated protein Cas6 n=1 Tax=Halorubrum coriense DSM 10284 TaxID=1227466 RepID=M0E6G7_9EURY|nr:CRISPR-associated protein Cas6 [Halorubrum coriense DSM 10284]